GRHTARQPGRRGLPALRAGNGPRSLPPQRQDELPSLVEDAPARPGPDGGGGARPDEHHLEGALLRRSRVAAGEGPDRERARGVAPGERNARPGAGLVGVREPVVAVEREGPVATRV